MLLGWLLKHGTLCGCNRVHSSSSEPIGSSWVSPSNIHVNIQMLSLCSLRSAPCVPHDIQNDLHCLSGVLNVTWQSTGDVSQFRASVASSMDHVSSCQTNKLHCVVHNVQCGLTYNVTVVAQDETCNSSQSPNEQILTGGSSSRNVSFSPCSLNENETPPTV